MTAQDLDYLAARLHGRRSRLAEGPTLESLSLLKSVPDLGRILFPEAVTQTAIEVQRRVVQALITEVAGLCRQLSGPEADFINWMLLHFDLANLKILLRGVFSHASPDILKAYLTNIPGRPTLDQQALSAATTVHDLARLLAKEPTGEMLQTAIAECRDQPHPFFIEALLDRRYFQDGLTRSERLAPADRRQVGAMVAQEAGLFHLMLATRGRFNYDLGPEKLMPLYVEGTPLSRKRFRAMLTAPTIADVAVLARGVVLDRTEGEAAGAHVATDPLAHLEIQAWRRYLRLANQAFRRSHTGFGVVAGYVGIRRMEAANLITLSEGIRAGMTGETIRSRMNPPAGTGVTHV